MAGKHCGKVRYVTLHIRLRIYTDSEKRDVPFRHKASGGAPICTSVTTFCLSFQMPISIQQYVLWRTVTHDMFLSPKWGMSHSLTTMSEVLKSKPFCPRSIPSPKLKVKSLSTRHPKCRT